MTAYLTRDGDVIYGDSAQEVVESMAQRKFSEPRSRTSYRRATARRIKWDGPEIRTDTDEAFVEDLVHIGYLTVLN